jgi:hypothetical protein
MASEPTKGIASRNAGRRGVAERWRERATFESHRPRSPVLNRAPELSATLRSCWSFEARFQGREIGRHLLSSLSTDDERDENFAYAVTLEVDRNSESGSIIGD